MTDSPSGSLPDTRDRSWVQRLLSPIAEVRREEVASVLLMTLAMFVILAAYYMLKTAREVFILSEGGAEVKSYSSAGQAILLLVLVPAYGAFASRVNRIQLIQWVTLFFASHIVLFLIALGAGLHVGIVYFLWVGIFNLMVIAQFWAFAADLYTSEQGKRLFPLIGVGASLGRLGRLGACGPADAGDGARASDDRRLRWTGRLRAVGSRHQQGHPQGRARRAGRPRRGAAWERRTGSRWSSRTATCCSSRPSPSCSTSSTRPASTCLAATSWRPRSATHGAGPEGEALREQFIGATYSRLYSTVNLLGFVLQMFVVSRVFKFLGVYKSLFIHPTIAFAGYLMMLRAPSITTMGWLKVADNSVDYSLGNTTKQALWLPTSREAKYKAKQAVDSFFVRAGDVVQAGLVFVGERLAFAVPAFAAVSLVLVGGWLAVVVLLNNHHPVDPDSRRT